VLVFKDAEGFTTEFAEDTEIRGVIALRGSIEERFLPARADAFTGSEREEKTSARFGRNDSLGASPRSYS
jgi:hypothetical protein